MPPSVICKQNWTCKVPTPSLEEATDSRKVPIWESVPLDRLYRIAKRKHELADILPHDAWTQAEACAAPIAPGVPLTPPQSETGGIRVPCPGGRERGAAAPSVTQQWRKRWYTTHRREPDDDTTCERSS